MGRDGGADNDQMTVPLHSDYRGAFGNAYLDARLARQIRIHMSPLDRLIGEKVNLNGVIYEIRRVVLKGDEARLEAHSESHDHCIELTLAQALERITGFGCHPPHPAS